MIENDEQRTLRIGAIVIVITILIGLGTGLAQYLLTSQEDETPGRMPFGPPNLPDLVIDQIEGKKDVKVGDTETYTFSVVNIGCCETGAFEVEVLVNSEEYHRETIADVTGGSTETFTIDLDFTEAGAVVIQATVQNAELEDSRLNNTSVLTISVDD